MKQIQIELNKIENSLAEIEKTLTHTEESLLYKIMFISEEIITNIARHADFEGKTPLVTLSLEEKNSLLIFKDNAKKFNMLEYPDPDIDEDIEKRELGGLGIFLTKKYAKKIDYMYEKGYNILRIEL